MKINREIIFKLNLKEDELENSKTAIETLLKTFIDEWRYSQKIIDLNKIIESNNSIYEIRFNIYYTPVNETAKGIIVTGFGNSKYESMFDSTAIQMQEFLNKNNYTYEIFAPVEKMSVGFEEFHSAIDDIEEELSKFKTIDDSIKVKLSYEIDGILKKMDYVLNNIKIIDDRILSFIKEYKIKLGMHKQTDIAIQKQYEKAIDSAKLLLNKTDKIQTDQIIHFREGSGYFDLGMFDNAIDEFQKALELKPEDVKIMNNLGWAFFLTDKYDKAAEIFENVIKLDCDNIFANNGLAASYFNNKRYEESIEIFNKVIQLSQDAESVYFAYNNLGQVYLLLNDYETAIKKYQKAIDIIPDKTDAHYNLANIYYNLGLFNEAIYEYNICLEINPDDVKAEAFKLTAEGQILLNENMIEDSIAKFKEAIDKGIAEPLFFNNLGAAYEKAGDYFKAIKSFKKSIEINPDYQIAYVNLGYISDKLNELEESKKYYKKAIDLKPDDIISLNNLGWDLYLLRSFDESEKCYLKALKINPHSLTTLNNLGWLYIKMGEYNKALGVYQTALEIDPNNAMSYNDIGFLYYKKNMLDKAILELNKSIRLNTDRLAMTYAYYHLGLVYLKKKMKDEAIASFQKSIKLDEFYIPAHYQLAIVYKNTDEFILSLKMFDKCISLNPNSKYAAKAKEQIKKLNLILKEEVEN